MGKIGNIKVKGVTRLGEVGVVSFVKNKTNDGILFEGEMLVYESKKYEGRKDICGNY